MGTGTGCIAITLARQIPTCTLVATDIVGGALELARFNAVEHEVADRIDFPKRFFWILSEMIEASTSSARTCRTSRTTTGPPWIRTYGITSLPRPCVVESMVWISFGHSFRTSNPV